MSEGQGLTTYRRPLQLPTVAVELPPCEGRNIDTEVLVLRRNFASAEDALAQFRMAHAPERLPYFRRYYLKPYSKKGGWFSGRYGIWYCWNTKAPSTDTFVGVMKGDDLATTQVLIGNNASGAFMTPISWILCEDRKGQEPISMGRFDYWSLFQGVTENDLMRLREMDLQPDIEGWRVFDGNYWSRTCPGCGQGVEVCYTAFNVDSARCSKCGIRPMLSRAINRSLCRIAETSSDITAKLSENSDELLNHLIDWMSQVEASPAELHQERLPEEVTPQRVFQQLLEMSSVMNLDSDGLGELPLATIAQLKISGRDALAITAQSAAKHLADTIRSGGRFTRVEKAMADLLMAVSE